MQFFLQLEINTSYLRIETFSVVTNDNFNFKFNIIVGDYGFNIFSKKLKHSLFDDVTIKV